MVEFPSSQEPERQEEAATVVVEEEAQQPQPVMMAFQGTVNAEKASQENGSDTDSSKVVEPIIIAPSEVPDDQDIFEETKAPSKVPESNDTTKTFFPNERLDLRRLRPQVVENTHPTVSTPPVNARANAPSVNQTSQEESKKPAASENSGPASDTSIFECNICLETAKEPVVSKCGHLYCWSCIYTWMNQPRDVMVCPVCKSGISADSVIPIYTRENNEDPRKKQESAIPGRPQGSRSEPEPNRNRGGGLFGGGGNGQGFVMGFGIFPTLFSLNFTWDDITGSNNGGARLNSEELRQQQLQHFLGVFLMFMLFSLVTFGSDVFLTF